MTSKTKASHTPGPWEVHEGTYTMRRGEFSVWPLDAKGDGDKRVACWITTQANAKLIAAAPDLLDALQATLNFVDDVKVQKKVIAAIEKATGD